MHLALAFGATVAELEDRMSIEELGLWSTYVSEYGLPFQRAEIMQAGLAQMIAKTMGGAKGDKLTDYMIRPPKRKPTKLQMERELATAFGPAIKLKHRNNVAAGALQVDLALNTADFERGATDAEASLKRIEDAAGKVGYAIGTALGTSIRLGIEGFALFEIAALGALKATDSLIKSVGEFNDIADKTGASAEGLAAIAQVAALSDTSIKSIADSSVILTKNLANVNVASKDAGRALEYLGLNLDTIKQERPDEQIQSIATALASVEDPASKTAIAIALFGKAGANLLPLLKDLNEQGTQQHVLSQQQIEDADAYTKAQEKFVNQLKLAAEESRSNLAPALQDLETALGSIVKDFLGFDETTGKFTKNNTIADWSETIISALSTLGDVVIVVRKIIEVLTVAIVGAVTVFDRLFHLDPKGVVTAFTVAVDQIGDIVDRKDKDFSERLAEAAAKRLADNHLKAASAIDSGDGGEGIANAIRSPFTSGNERTAKGPDPDAAVNAAIKAIQSQIDKEQDLTDTEKVLRDIQDGRYKSAHTNNIQRLKDIALEADSLKGMDKQIKENREQSESDKQFQEAIDRRLAGLDKETTAYKTYGDNVAFIQGEQDKKNITDEKANQLIQEQADILNKQLNPAYKTQAELLKDRTATIDKLTGNDKTKEFDKSLEDINTAFENGEIGIDTYIQALQGLGDKFSDTAKDSNTFAKQAAANIQDIVSGGIFDALEGKVDNFPKLFKQMLDKLVAQALAAKLSSALFGDNFGKTGQVSGLAGQAGSFLGSIGSYFSGLFGSGGAGAGADVGENLVAVAGGGFAAGGVPPAGKISLVGERGPELVVGNGAARVVPLTGGGGATVNMTVVTKDAASFTKSNLQVARDVRTAINRTARAG